MDTLQKARELVSEESSSAIFDEIKKFSSITVQLDGERNKRAETLCKELSGVFNDIAYAFPQAPKNCSSVDFLCETDIGLVTVEFQVVKQNNWDSRAMYYLSCIHANQLKSGKTYDDLVPVVGISLLGVVSSGIKV